MKLRTVPLGIEQRLRLILGITTIFVLSIAGVYFYYIDRTARYVSEIVITDLEVNQKIRKTWMAAQTLRHVYENTWIGWRDLQLSDFLSLLKHREKQPSFQDAPFFSQLSDLILQTNNATAQLGGLSGPEYLSSLYSEKISAEIQKAFMALSKELNLYLKTLEDFRNSKPVQFERSKSDQERATRDRQNQQRDLQRQIDRHQKRRMSRPRGKSKDIQEQNDILDDKVQTLEDKIQALDHEIIQIKTEGLRQITTNEERLGLFYAFRRALKGHEEAISKSQAALSHILQSHVDDSRQAILTTHQDLKIHVDDAYDVMTIIIIVSLFTGVLFTTIGPRQAALPMKRIISLIQGVREGRYTISPRLETNDDIGILFRHIHHLIRTEEHLEQRRRDSIMTRDKRFQFLVDQLKLKVIVLSTDRHTSFVSQAFLSATKLNRKDIMGHHLDSPYILNNTNLDPEFINTILKSLKHRDKQENTPIERILKNEEDQHMLTTFFIRDIKGEISEELIIISK